MSADQVQESARFQALKRASMNALVNNSTHYSTWQPDAVQQDEANNAVARMENTLSEGILMHAAQKRLQALEKTVARTCYSKNNDLNFLEAQKCEEYHYKNDYKLNMISKFVTDHSVRLL